MNTILRTFLWLTLTAMLPSMAFSQCNAVDFEISQIGTAANTMSYRTVIDFDGDGKLDFAGHYENGTSAPNNVSIFRNDGVGGLVPITMTVSNPAGGTFWRGDWADFNGDGRPDMLAYFSSEPRMVIYYNNGNSDLTRGNTLTFGSPSEYIADMAEVNHDNRIDLITTGPPFAGTDEPTHYLYLSNGDGTYAPSLLIAAEHADVRFGDFNGDGSQDISIVKDVSNSPDYTSRFWMQTPGGRFDQIPAVSLGTFRPIGVEDFNRDRRSDLYGSVSFTSLSFLTSNETGEPIRRDYAPTYMDGTYRLYFGDFNGDGIRDVLDSGRANDASMGYSVFFGNAANGFRVNSKAVPLNDQNFNQVANAVDFDNDGRTDLVRFTSDLSNNRVTAQLLRSVCRTAGQTDTVDFDGDLKTDQTMWNAASGKWSVLSSSQPNVQAKVTYFGNGNLGDTPAAGDYDGDGKTDHAVYRDSTGVWYILQSSDGGVRTENFGLTGDKPVAADYDGDGKTDIAVFRAAEAYKIAVKKFERRSAVKAK